MTALRAVVDLPPYAAELFKPHRYKILWGGRGAGRSWSIARALLVLATERPLRILCCREFQASIKDSVHQLLRDQVAMIGLPGYVVTEREVRHVNGSLFVFAGLRFDVDKIKSLEGIDVAWIEEAHRVSEASFAVLQPTVRKVGSEIWASFNPELESDAIYRRFVLTRPPDAWVKKVGWQDNPWFPEALRLEKQYLEKVDPESAAHIWGGELRQSTGAQVLHGKWVIDDVDPQPDWDGPYHGLDFGFSTDPTALVQVYVAGGTLHVQRELYRMGLELDDTTVACQAAVPGCEAYVLRADSARPESISYLKRHGLPRVESVEKWGGSVEDGIAYLRQFERIVVHSRCKHWITEARTYSYKVDERSGDILPVIVDKSNHLMDATRYSLQPLIRRRQSAFHRVGLTSGKYVKPLFAKPTP